MTLENEFLTVEEAGRVLGISVSTVWRRIRSGEVQSVRRGGRRLISSRTLHRGRSERGASDGPPFDEKHPIFRLVGAARSGGGAPGARDKHAILDE
jgi:excisionase family DNA binding protein